MSLVAYAASSDEELDYEDDSEATKAEVVTAKPTAKLSTSTTNGHGNISDEDDDYAPAEVALHELKKPGPFSLSLPKPKNTESSKKDLADEINDYVTPTFSKLPMPKSADMSNTHTIAEEDDEFLHKKAIPSKNDAKEKPPPPPSSTKGPVKITIPSMKDFSDVDKELANRQNNKATTSKAPKGSGLMSILPQAKSEQNFAKVTTTSKAAEFKSTTPISKPAFIPDTVKNRRPAHNTEGVDGIKDKQSISKKSTISAEKAKISLVTCSGSDESDEDEEETGDFFSLNRSQKLPEVSSNEINAMVAKRAAKMAAATTKYLDSAAAEKEMAEATSQMDQDDEELRCAQKRYYQQQELGAEAMQALVGSNAKRRRREGANEIQVMDISSDQVLPNREEWMRTALASSTSYQPTGVLVDEEPVAGTRRKHQITYLAHKAKANEAELQAMWAANRQNRRATQSKYGF